MATRPPRQRASVSGADDLPAELARIAGLDTVALRSLWLKITGTPPSRQLSGDLLRRMVMHYVQERALGGLDRRLTSTLDRLADGGGIVPGRLRLGSVLVREYGGLVHQVMVVQDGFAWNDRVLPSLSAVAQAITGTKWNGYRFFGLGKSGAGKPCVSKADRSPVGDHVVGHEGDTPRYAALKKRATRSTPHHACSTGAPP